MVFPKYSSRSSLQRHPMKFFQEFHQNFLRIFLKKSLQRQLQGYSYFFIHSSKVFFDVVFKITVSDSWKDATKYLSKDFSAITLIIYPVICSRSQDCLFEFSQKFLLSFQECSSQNNFKTFFKNSFKIYLCKFIQGFFCIFSKNSIGNCLMISFRISI